MAGIEETLIALALQPAELPTRQEVDAILLVTNVATGECTGLSFDVALTAGALCSHGSEVEFNYLAPGALGKRKVGLWTPKLGVYRLRSNHLRYRDGSGYFPECAPAETEFRAIAVPEEPRVATPHPPLSPAGIPANVFLELRDALDASGYFASIRRVHTLFGDGRLAPWAGRVPEADSPFGRIEEAIEFMKRQEAATGENGLVLLLQVVADRVDPADACHARLQALAQRLRDLS